MNQPPPLTAVGRLAKFWQLVRENVFSDGDLQDKAVEAGLLVGETFDSTKGRHANSENSEDFEDGDTIYFEHASIKDIPADLDKWVLVEKGLILDAEKMLEFHAGPVDLTVAKRLRAALTDGAGEAKDV